MNRNGIYISGAVTGAEGYKERFAKAEECLKGVIPGKPIFNPVSIIEGYPGFLSHETCMEICINALSYCDTIYMLSDWKSSKGANREYGYALGSDMTIIFESDNNPEEVEA